MKKIRKIICLLLMIIWPIILQFAFHLWSENYNFGQVTHLVLMSSANINGMIVLLLIFFYEKW